MSEALPAPVRHLLLVATQSNGADNGLPSLETAAEELYAALTDPAVGGCVPSPGADALRLRSGTVRRREIDDAVRAATRVAGEAGATLVLAFLGHGQTAQGSPKLWYMAADSEEGRALDCVDIGAAVTTAANHPGVAGVVVVVDTCHAAAGMPDVKELAAGFGVGGLRVSALAACSALEKAYALGLSHQLAAVLGRGLPTGEEFLSFDAVREAVAGAVAEKQTVAGFTYNGDGDTLWLARNRQWPPRQQAASPSGFGAADLAAALAEWPDAPPGPPPRDLRALSALADRAAAAGAWRVQETAEAVIASMQAVALLVDVAGPALTSPVLRRLAAGFNRRWAGVIPEPVRPPSALTGRALLQYLLEHAALRASGAAGGASVYAAVAWYLVAGAHACGADPQDPRIRDWARRTGAEIALNDALAQHGDGPAGDRARRLVISLDAAQVDWPDSLSVCLREGPDCVHHRHFDCRPDRDGVERALPDILDWADALLPGCSPVAFVDLVAHAPVLVDWHPEEVLVGRRLLGVTRTVTLRWAGRLVERGHLRGINREARSQLEQLEQKPLDDGVPVDWVDPGRTGPEQLFADLTRGRYQRAVGLTEPVPVPRLLELVTAFLPYTPIVLWPHRDTEPTGEGWGCLDHLWDGLPDGFGAAYRYKMQAGGDPAPVTDAHLLRLAALRTAWHDLDWLDFCGRYDRHPAPPMAPVPPTTPTSPIAPPTDAPAPRST
ncbi:vWA-MoxR associated conflict system protein [Kitasatospora purpeofusca]|uniref:vWA-MoxR associated conflict system protein n=1 Tax=Kitasatospora purpeofusca TaxID=67352 RepID=UPI00367C0176